MSLGCHLSPDADRLNWNNKTMIEYHPTCISEGNHRFALEQPGEKVLIVIGVNPSTADENKPDPTMQSVLRFVNASGYDGFVMLNLSSERCTWPNDMATSIDLPMHNKYMEVVSEMGKKYPDADILLAFGNNIESREYLMLCFYEIHRRLASHKRWLCIGGSASLTKRGHPRHPLYASPKLGLYDFDIAAYTRYEYYYPAKMIAEHQDLNQDLEWRWCLVGNIVREHPFGEDKEIRQGTKQFAPGAKVYCAKSMWGDGYENIGVIGAPRHGHRLIEIIMESKKIENFRIQKVFKPAVLEIMKQRHYRWWGNTDKDRDSILQYLRWLNPEKYHS